MKGPEYPKIQSVWKRTRQGEIIVGEYSTPELEWLSECEWSWTEKVDGTNIRLDYEQVGFRGNEHAYINGRTNNAQIPKPLVDRLVDLLKSTPFEKVFPSDDDELNVTFYGEGYGARIQKGGGNYNPDGVDFVLFDVLVNGSWLQRHDVVDIALTLDLDVVPLIGTGSLLAACDKVREGFASFWGDEVTPEGLVMRPPVRLYDRNGRPLMSKIKAKDYQRVAP